MILMLDIEQLQIALQNTFVKNSTNEDLSLEGDQGHFNAVFDIAWMPYHLKLVSASGDHTARLWDVTESKLISIREFCGHTRSVKVVNFRKNDCSVFATGGRDGAVLIWDLRSSANGDVIQKADNRIYSAHVGNGPTTPSTRRRGTRNTTPKLPPNVSNSSVTGLVFQDENTLITCGPGDGVIKVWDLRRCYSTLKKEPIAKYNLPYAGKSTFKGFTNLIVDEAGTRLYASCMDSKIYSYNVSTYSQKPSMVYSGMQINTFYIKSCLSPDGQYLLSGSSDEKAYIWNLKHPEPVVTLGGHNYEVTCVAWSQHQNNLDGGNMCLVTCSDDACHKIWRIGPEEVPDDEVMFLKGRAEAEKDYFQFKKKVPLKQQLKLLESTPRSLKRLIEQSETTPTTTSSGIVIASAAISSSNRKRSFQEMNRDEPPESVGSDKKRPNLETRGRRLFSPVEPSTSNFPDAGININYFEGPTKSLTTILEELDSPASKNFHNLSPSPVKRQLNIIKSPESVRVCNFASPHIPRHRQPPAVNSPTTNLPNFVVDGDAPHLGLMSPQRKLKKENVDWLTKMRKQKLLSLNINGALDKSTSSPEHLEDGSTEKLKSIENKAELKKQKKNETILKFFTVKPSGN
jgi:denticleless